jgi:diadenosine tetraphosphatase ApaH/serine/threonine PP2A family protein phosphatase
MNNAVAILSDIHGNAHALQAVLRDMETQGINERICLGDVVGYGCSPNECIDLVQQHDFRCVKGNHDAMVASNQGMDAIADNTRFSIEWTRSQLSPSQLVWLESLPLSLQGVGYEAVHAALHQAEDWPYVLMVDMAALHFHHQTQPLCFIGHTHRPAFWVDGEALGVDITSLESLRPNNKCLVNVGAVGQPRDRDERACYAIYRREERDILWRRVPYDIAGAQQVIIDAGMPAYFAQRLALGR